jgi:hypothetical protein
MSLGTLLTIILKKSSENALVAKLERKKALTKLAHNTTIVVLLW